MAVVWVESAGCQQLSTAIYYSFKVLVNLLITLKAVTYHTSEFEGFI